VTAARERIGVLFVCHANICRSPLAEGVFAHLVRAEGLEDRFMIDSAGCWATDGDDPHPLSIAVAAEHGIDLLALVGRSRGLVPDDLHRFDHVIAMDRANLADLQRLRRLSALGPVTEGKARVRLLRAIERPDVDGRDADVPDPIGRGPVVYGSTFDLVERACKALLRELVPTSAGETRGGHER
jgi:protein-tyrosine phosphatase